MSYTKPNLKQIYVRVSADMETRINSKLSADAQNIKAVQILRESFLGIISVVFSGAVYLLYGFIDYLSKQILPDTAEEDWLVRHANLYGLTRKSATFATGTVELTGTAGTTVDSGTLLQTNDSVQFAADSDVTIASGETTASVSVTAVDAGTSGNVGAAAIDLVSAIDGVDSVAFTTGADGATDQETIEELRTRLLLKLRTPVSGGRASDYSQWAESITGCVYAWTIDAYMGVGTVGVMIAGENKTAVSDDVKTAVADYIETKRPLGVLVYVYSVVPVIIGFTIAVPSGTSDDLKTSIRTALADLFNDESKISGTILLSHIQSAIMSTGISDYSISGMTVSGASVTVGNITATGLNLYVTDSGSITFEDL